MPPGPLSPEINAAFTKTPEVVYAETVFPRALVMYRFVPSVAMPSGPFSPEIKEAFTVSATKRQSGGDRSKRHRVAHWIIWVESRQCARSLRPATRANVIKLFANCSPLLRRP